MLDILSSKWHESLIFYHKMDCSTMVDLQTLNAKKKVRWPISANTTNTFPNTTNTFPNTTQYY